MANSTVHRLPAGAMRWRHIFSVVAVLGTVLVWAGFFVGRHLGEGGGECRVLTLLLVTVCNVYVVYRLFGFVSEVRFTAEGEVVVSSRWRRWRLKADDLQEIGGTEAKDAPLILVTTRGTFQIERGMNDWQDLVHRLCAMNPSAKIDKF